MFVTLVGMLRCLRSRGYFTGDVTQPDLLGYIDIVALATVCDVVPLRGLNRAFVRQGLKVMAERRHAGLTKLADVAGMNSAPNVHALASYWALELMQQGELAGQARGEAASMLRCGRGGGPCVTA